MSCSTNVGGLPPLLSLFALQDTSFVQDLKDLSTLIIVAVAALLALIFRSEITKLVTWISTLRRIAAKTKQGYSLDAEAAQPEIRPEGTETQQAQKAIELQSGEHSERTRAPESKPNWIAALFEKRYDDAVAALQEDLKRENDALERVRIRSWIGFVLFEKKQEEGAEYFERLIAENLTSLVPYQFMAMALQAADLNEESIKVADRGLSRLPSNLELTRLKADGLVALGRFDDAVAVLTGAIQNDPKNSDLYLLVANVLLKKGARDDAKAWLRSGLRVSPRDEALLSKSGSVAAEDGHREEALLRYSVLVEVRSENPDYLALQGNAYFALGLQSMALRAYKKADALAKGKAGWIQANIGNLLKNQGLFSEGIDYLKRAVDIDPGSKYAHERLAVAMTQQEEEEKKASAILQAVRLSPALQASSTPQLPKPIAS